MYKLSSLILMMSLWLTVSYAQQDVFVGSFTNTQKNVSLRMKAVQGGYNGVVQSQDGVVAVSAQKVGQGLSGLIYNGKVENYPVYKNYLLQGRWRIGNTQYAMQRNKAVCY